MYLKITNEKEKHHGLQYQDGVVEDILPFNNDPQESCCKGGIYFSNEKYILYFIDYGSWIRQVEIPEDAQWLKDRDGNKWRASKLFFHPRKKLWDGETFQWMFDNGVDFQYEGSLLLRRACKHKSLSALKFLLEKTSVDIDESGALYTAVEVDFLDGVNCLIEHGANIHANQDTALRYAVRDNRLDIIEVLIKHGADKHEIIKTIWKYDYDVNDIKVLVEYGAGIWFLPFRPMMKMFWHRLKFNFNKLFKK